MEKKYSVNPFLVAHPRPITASWVVIDYDSKQEYEIGDFRILSFLFLQTDFLSRSQLEKKIIQSDYEKLQDGSDIVSFLIKEKLLLEEGAEQWIKSKSIQTWHSYGWDAAANYFLYTYDYPFIDYAKPNSREIEECRMSDYFAEAPPPNIYKEYDDVPLIMLSTDWNSYSDVAAYENGLLKIEPFGFSHTSSRLSLKDISALLLFSIGKTGEIRMPIQGYFLQKNVPSGGARHPTEGYVIPLRSRSSILGNSVYHYSVAKHALEEIGPISSADLAETLLEDEIVLKDFSVLIILTSVVTRSMWRYRESRSYRVIHNDVGHVLTAIQILARSRNRDTMIVHNFLDTKLRELLMLKSETEILMSCVLIK